MAALNRIPERDKLEAVLVRREGIGFRVGVGPIVAGRIEREACSALSERDAARDALALADRLDLIVVRV